MHFNIYSIVAPAVAFTALILIDRMPDKHVLENPYFNRQRWTLRNGYLVVIPTIVMVWVTDLTRASAGLALATDIVYVTGTCALYYLLIHKPHNVDKTMFGLEKSSFLSKGIPTANVVIPLWILAVGSADQMATAQPVLAARPTPEAGVIAALSLVDLCLVTPLRELLFRGVLYPSASRKIGRCGSIVVLSLTHCLIFLGPSRYATPVDISYAALVGFLFSVVWYLLYVSTRSLYPPIMVHMALQLWSTKLAVYGALESRVDALTFDKLWCYIPIAVLIVIDMYWIVAKYVTRSGGKKSEVLSM